MKKLLILSVLEINALQEKPDNNNNNNTGLNQININLLDRRLANVNNFINLLRQQNLSSTEYENRLTEYLSDSRNLDNPYYPNNLNNTRK